MASWNWSGNGTRDKPMRIVHWVKKENSGLFRTTFELAENERQLGHEISLRTPKEQEVFYGFKEDEFDIHCIHSQIPSSFYKDGKPKILFMHGEPDYGMLYKKSTTAIMDLAPIVDAFVAFNEDEANLWNSFKRTYVIPKGIDIDSYRPVELPKKLEGSPAILYAEHWRSFRHPFHTFVALEKIAARLPKMRFYPFGCPPEEKAFWLRLINQNKYNVFCPGVFQPQKNMAGLLNMADIVVSPVFPSYGRVSLEALACNKPVVAYKTNPHATFKCEPYNPNDMAEKVFKCWEEKPNGQRKYAEENLSAKVMAEKAIDIYRRFI
jgi:glycosyltransferase involved in cell wall biosynthesis